MTWIPPENWPKDFKPEQEPREIPPQWALSLFAVGIVVAMLYGIFFVLTEDAHAFETPTEPPIEQHEYWEPLNSGLVAIWFADGGIMVGFAHRARNELTSEQPGQVWYDTQYAYMVTNDAEQPALYIVELEPVAYKHPFLSGWQMLVQKTWNSECGCPYE